MQTSPGQFIVGEVEAEGLGCGCGECVGCGNGLRMLCLRAWCFLNFTGFWCCRCARGFLVGCGNGWQKAKCRGLVLGEALADGLADGDGLALVVGAGHGTQIGK